LKVEAYESYEWRELHEITQMKDGCIYRTRKTGFHIKANDIVPEGFKAVTISCKPGDIIEINRYAD